MINKGDTNVTYPGWTLPDPGSDGKIFLFDGSPNVLTDVEAVFGAGLSEAPLCSCAYTKMEYESIMKNETGKNIELQLSKETITQHYLYYNGDSKYCSYSNRRGTFIFFFRVKIPSASIRFTLDYIIIR